MNASNSRANRVLCVAAVLLAGAALAVSIARPAPAGRPLCSDNPCVIRAANNGADGLRVVGSKGTRLDHPFMVTDWQGAPQFFVDVGSVDTGDLPLCVTSGDLSDRACLSPGIWDAARGQYVGAGFVTLWDARGRHPVMLTARDISYLHWLEGALRRARWHEEEPHGQDGAGAMPGR